MKKEKYVRLFEAKNPYFIFTFEFDNENLVLGKLSYMNEFKNETVVEHGNNFSLDLPRVYQNPLPFYTPQKYNDLKELLGYDWEEQEWMDYAIGNIFLEFEQTLKEIIKKKFILKIEDSFGGEYSINELKKLSRNADKTWDRFYIDSYLDVKNQKENEAIENYLEDADDILEELDISKKDLERIIQNNRKTRGTAWESLVGYDTDDFPDFEEQIEILRRMGVAEHRHKDTNYDTINKQGMSQDQVSRLRKGFN